MKAAWIYEYTNEIFPSLAEIERGVIAESREWGRKRLEDRLQALADQQGEATLRAAQTPKARPAQRVAKHVF